MHMKGRKYLGDIEQLLYSYTRLEVLLNIQTNEFYTTRTMCYTYSRHLNDHDKK